MVKKVVYHEEVEKLIGKKSDSYSLVFCADCNEIHRIPKEKVVG